MSQNPGKATICEIRLKDGRPCGVSAIGRCTTCERAFCSSHQARTSTNVDANLRFMPFSVPVYLDMCIECFATSPMELSRIKAEEDAARYEQEQKEEERKRYEAIDYFTSGAARTALLTKGVQTVEIYQIEKRWKDGRFFWQAGRYINEVICIGRGWLLGELDWGPIGEIEMRLTALVDLSPKSHNIYQKGLVPVRHYSDGYEVLPIPHNLPHNEWIAAAQAVKRLAGESS